MRNKIEELKRKYVNAETDSEIESIREGIRKLCDEDASGVAKATLDSIRETNAVLLRERIKDILPAVSVSYLAKVYLKKSPSWFYQRLNGNSVNGKTAQFTSSELHTIQHALLDISKKINASASVVF